MSAGADADADATIDLVQATLTVGALKECRLWPLNAHTETEQTRLLSAVNAVALPRDPTPAEERCPSTQRQALAAFWLETTLAAQRHDLLAQLSVDTASAERCQCSEAFQDYLDVLQKPHRWTWHTQNARVGKKPRTRYCDHFDIFCPRRLVHDDPPALVTEPQEGGGDGVGDYKRASARPPRPQQLQPTHGLALSEHGHALHRPVLIPRLVSLHGGSDRARWALVRLRLRVHEQDVARSLRMVVVPSDAPVYTSVVLKPEPTRHTYATVFAILPPRDVRRKNVATAVLGHAYAADDKGTPLGAGTLIDCKLPAPTKYDKNDPLQALWLGHLHAFSGCGHRVPRTTSLCMGILRMISPIALLPWNRIVLQTEWTIVYVDESPEALSHKLSDTVAHDLARMAQ